MGTVWLALLTGLTTGGISCLAVQGGLLASSVSQQEKNTESDMHRWLSTAIFLLSKLIAYTVLGFLLGSIGATLTFTPKMLGMVQIAAGLFMLATAARLANVHPIFRFLVFQPPRFVYRLLKRSSRDTGWIAPVSLGFLTVLMPCGVTQATMAVAVASGNPWLGAAIMFAFVLGTSPIFFVLGTAINELMKRRIYSYVAASVVAVFGILSVNGGIALQGSFYTIQNIWKAAVTPADQLAYLPSGDVAGVSVDGVQSVRIVVENNGYVASSSILKAGVPVKLTLTTDNTRGCTRAFTIPEYGISKALPETGEETIEFTPTQTGRLAYACGMGMYTGQFNVIP